METIPIGDPYSPQVLAVVLKLPLDGDSTAELAANSPRFRRTSSTYVDAIHDLPEKLEMAPAQLYSTESGRLFHAGRIVIVTVGLPARGKTYAGPELSLLAPPAYG